jgi:hypothetical protein
MSELDSALDRLGAAVANLISASNSGGAGEGAARDAATRIAKLTEERDKMRAEIDELRALREDDARLRADAADAVKIALTDLRSLVAAKKKAG